VPPARTPSWSPPDVASIGGRLARRSCGERRRSGAAARPVRTARQDSRPVRPSRGGPGSDAEQGVDTHREAGAVDHLAHGEQDTRHERDRS